MNDNYQLERIDAQIEQIAQLIGIAYDLGLIVAATDGLNRGLKRLNELSSGKTAIKDRLFIEDRKSAA